MELLISISTAVITVIAAIWGFVRFVLEAEVKKIVEPMIKEMELEQEKNCKNHKEAEEKRFSEMKYDNSKQFEELKQLITKLFDKFDEFKKEFYQSKRYG